MTPDYPLEEMVGALRRLVEAESFSTDRDGLAACRKVIAELCRTLVDAEPRPEGEHLVLRREAPGRPILLLFHYDTVWPTGTLEEFPFTVEDGVARGPGAFDMKGGIVQGLYALRGVRGPVTALFTGDEEIGSWTSRPIIEREARRSRAVLVLEPAEGRAVKLARKGVGDWKVEVRGRAAHAGLAPESGVNATVELAHQIVAIQELARPEEGTTVSVTTLGGGSASNVIPEHAWCAVDVRAWTDEEASRVEKGLRSLSPVLPGAVVDVTGEFNRGPMEREVTEPLYERLVALGYDVGGADVGGGSDGNLTAALGIPTLDGLGPVGGGAHARDEHVIVEEMPSRAEMVRRLIEDLLENEPAPDGG